MATTRPSRGRPRRTEAVKRVKLRESTFLLWNQRKEALGLAGIMNSEFAEMLLHQNMDAILGETRRGRGESGGHASLTPTQGKKSLNFICSEFL